MYWKDAFSVFCMYRKKMLFFRVLMEISCSGPFSWKKGVSEGGSNFTKIDEISIWNLLLSRVSHVRSGNQGSGGQNTIFAFSMVLCDFGQKSDFLTRNLVKLSFSKYPGNVWKYSLLNHGWSKGGCMLQGCLPVTRDACFIFARKWLAFWFLFEQKETSLFSPTGKRWCWIPWASSATYLNDKSCLAVLSVIWRLVFLWFSVYGQ